MGLLDLALRSDRDARSASRSAQGLLGKATSLTEAESDTDEVFETAFIERVRRLPVSDSTPYTALSLLKAFHPFSAGMCLALHDDSYECVASIGIERAVPDLSSAALFPEGSEEPHRIGSAEDFDIASASPSSDTWVFPIGCTEGLPRSALILVAEPGGPFAVETLTRVIRTCSDYFKIENKDRHDLIRDIKKALVPALVGSPCQLIVLSKDGQEDLAEEASAAVAAIGSAIPLGVGKALIIVGMGHDRELLAHRLAKSLKAVAIAGTEVADLDAAQEFLRAFS